MHRKKTSNSLLGMHMSRQVQQSVRVSPFVIVPSHDFEELQSISNRTVQITEQSILPEGSAPYTTEHR
jgi:ABC-type transporter Mla maintaining outer membrane lipid asymmetry ATPase subunit MlaF